MKHALRAAAVAVTLGALASPASGAQDRPTGWIGISYDVSYDRRGRPVEVVITEVVGDSPAEEAGVRRGDRLIAVNDLDGPSELARLPQRLHPRVGDPIRLVVRRDGERHVLSLRAADRPDGFAASQRIDVRVDTDSIVDAMVRAMDSLRLRLVEERGHQEVVVRRSRDAAGGAWTVVSERPKRVQAPFEFFVFRGEQHDSLHQEMVELNAVIADLQTQIELRTSDVARRADSASRVRRTQDRELLRLEAEMADAARRAQRLEVAMAEAARSRAGFEYTRPRAEPEPDPEPVVAWSDGSDEYRPLTPYLLGRNRVAGAEVIDLRPELARYFDVEAGVLVVDVAPRTPAALSGIVPGDVITRLDRVPVRSVDDLRFGISQAGETLPIALVRRGSSIQVLLRR